MKNNVFLLCGTLLLLFLCMEALFRLAGFHGINLNFRPVQYSQELGWKLADNYREQWTSLEWNVSYATNSRGFRDREHALDKVPDRKRILVLGDSQAEGWGVAFDDMWQNVLKEKIDGRWEVINLGTRGYDIIQEYRQFFSIGRFYSPDLVIQILDPNDWARVPGTTLMEREQRFRPSFRIAGSTIEFPSLPPEPSDTAVKNDSLHSVKSIAYKSAFISWLSRRLSSLEPVNSLMIKAGIRKEAPLPEISDYDANYKKAAEIIYSEIGQLQESLFFKFVVLYVGSEIPQDLKIILDKENIESLAVKLNKQELWRYDNHPNKKGHAVIAEALLQRLKFRGLI